MRSLPALRKEAASLRAKVLTTRLWSRMITSRYFGMMTRDVELLYERSATVFTAQRAISVSSRDPNLKRSRHMSRKELAQELCCGLWFRITYCLQSAILGERPRSLTLIKA